MILSVFVAEFDQLLFMQPLLCSSVFSIFLAICPLCLLQLTDRGSSQQQQSPAVASSCQQSPAVASSNSHQQSPAVVSSHQNSPVSGHLCQALLTVNRRANEVTTQLPVGTCQLLENGLPMCQLWEKGLPMCQLWEKGLPM